jgi:hypothetical protein
MDNNPIVSIGVGITGLVQSFFNWTTPLLQWLILVGTLMIIVLTIINTFKKGVK